VTAETTPTGRPLRRDAVRNRELLFDAAADVFAEQGLDAHVDEIARVAGVGVGTLYRRFPTKDALIDALVRDLLTRMLEAGEDALALANGTGLEVFLGFAAELQARRRGCLPRLWAGDPDMRVAICDLIASLVVDAQRHGRVREDLTAQDVIVALWGIRGIIETTKDIAPDAWRRQLELQLLGFRPSDGPLLNPTLAVADVTAVASSGARAVASTSAGTPPRAA
jgi:AcrR family transcriptional regulator